MRKVILSLLEDYLKKTNLEETFERLLYSTGEAGGKEYFMYLNPSGQDTKLEQEISSLQEARVKSEFLYQLCSGHW